MQNGTTGAILSETEQAQGRLETRRLDAGMRYTVRTFIDDRIVEGGEGWAYSISYNGTPLELNFSTGFLREEAAWDEAWIIAADHCLADAVA